MTNFTIALIPARAGSKRVPGKNTKILAGKPLIQYSIEHAIAARSIDMVVVSTNDNEATRIADRLDCFVLNRPVHLAGDDVAIIEVIKHCIKDLSRKWTIDYLVLLPPTSPIRDVRKIDEAVGILKSMGCDSVVSYVKIGLHHPNVMRKIVDGRSYPYCEQEIENVPRSHLPDAYHRDGSIIAMKASLPIERNTMYGDDIRAIIHTKDQALDIDTKLDFQIAEWIMEKKQ